MKHGCVSRIAAAVTAVDGPDETLGTVLGDHTTTIAFIAARSPDSLICGLLLRRRRDRRAWWAAWTEAIVALSAAKPFAWRRIHHVGPDELTGICIGSASYRRFAQASLQIVR